MTTPPDRDGSRLPRVEPAPGVVLVCETCDHIWEPSPAELGAGPVPCTQCEGWTIIAEIAVSAEQTSPADGVVRLFGGRGWLDVLVPEV